MAPRNAKKQAQERTTDTEEGKKTAHAASKEKPEIKDQNAPKQPAKRSRAAKAVGAAVEADAQQAAPAKRAKQAKGSAATDADNANGDTNIDKGAETKPPKGAQHSKAAKQAGEAQGGKDEPGEGEGPRYYLMKSEPEEFSLDDLASKPNQTSHWEGVRNAQARNIMRGMREGEEAFFYHSSCKVPAVVGVVRVAREAYPDHFAFEKSSKYYDARSTPEAPKWWMVDVQLVRRLARPVTLAELRAEGAKGPPVADMVLINKSRLSVQPVTAAQWARVLQLEREGGSEGGAGQGAGKEGESDG